MHENKQQAGTLFYYFAFPHYRKEILTEIRDAAGPLADFVSGTTRRGSIAAMKTSDFAPLRTVQSIKFGPFTWDRGVLKELWNRKYSNYVVGPAISSLSTWAMLFLARLTQKKVYLWGQCGVIGDRTPRRFAQELMNRLANGLFLYGANENLGAQELGLSTQKIRVVRNATRSNDEFITPEYGAKMFESVRHNIKELTEGRPSYVVYVGRLTAEKRIDVLFQAIRKLQVTFPNLELKIVGDGPVKGTLENDFVDVKADFLGWIYDSAELEDVFQHSVAAVSPYHMGLMAVDALRFGTPVLVPDNPRCGSEVECLTHGINSVEFRAGDHAALSEAFNTLISTIEYVDPEGFLAERERNLRVWAPKSVAKNIMDAVNSNNW